MELLGSGSGTVNIGNIETAIKNQLGMQDLLAELEIIPLSASIYAPTNDPLKIEADFYDCRRYPQSEDPSKLATISDWSGRNHYPHIHFKWRGNKQLLPYSNGTPLYVIRVDENVETVDQVLVLWRVSLPAGNTSMPRKIQLRESHYSRAEVK